ncbi:MAG: CPBP family intramembrane glutamic endopeptidase [Anaerolineae bacterium]
MSESINGEVSRGVMAPRGRLGLFLILVFALSWGFDLALALTIGHPAFLDLGLAPWSMFVPAAVAFVLQLALFRDSPIHLHHGWHRALLIPISYLALTVLYGIVTLLAIALPTQGSLFGGLGNLLTTLWTLALFTAYGQVGREGFRRAGLPLGNIGAGFKIALGVAAFLLLQSALNLALGLGDFPGVQEQVYGVNVTGGLYPVAVVLVGALAMTGTPLAGLAPTFGEEYAWRGILPGAWRRYGARWAALLSGLVWGVWHLPIILAGIHTYPPTVLGVLLALVFFVLWGMVQSYAVLRTGSIWVAAFLHGLVNSVYAFGLTTLVRPEDKIWSFGLGLYGLLCLAPIVFILLREPIWRREDTFAEEEVIA